ncbi:MAG: hypothetical protein H0U79_01245 [Solirubrobacterales bacterium]|nr:hypothetical protein [Solirubrobacterales bacterium]
MLEQLFTALLRQCTEAGLVGGRRLLVDATHVEADTALKSLRAELSLVDGDGEMVTVEPPPRPKLALAEPRTGATPKRTASNATTAIDRQAHAEGAIAELKHHGCAVPGVAAPARPSSNCSPRPPRSTSSASWTPTMSERTARPAPTTQRSTACSTFSPAA